MAQISDEMSQAIKDLRNAGFSQNGTSDLLTVNRHTVRDHEPEDVDGYDEDLDKTTENAIEALSPGINPREVMTDEYLPDDMDPVEADDIVGDPTGNEAISGDRDEGLLTSDLGELSPGEFIEKFFDAFEVGVKNKFVVLQASRADRKQELPDEEKMRSDLLEMASGISNPTEAQYISEEYWDQTEKYLRESDAQVFRGGDTPGVDSTEEGGFVSPGDQQASAGSWHQLPGQGMVYGQWVEGPNGSRQFQQMQPPQGGAGQQGGMNPGGMGQQAPGQQDRTSDELLREIRRLRKEVNDDGGGKNGADSLSEMIGEVQSIKSALDQLEGDDGGQQNEEMVRALRQELRGLKQEMSQPSQQAATGDPLEQMFQQAMTRDDVTVDQMMALADKLEGDVDPEVRKAEIDRDLEQQRMQQKTETTKKAVEGLQSVAEAFGSGIANSLKEDDDQPASQQQPSPGDQQGAPQGAAAGQEGQQRFDGGQVQEGVASTTAEAGAPENGNRPWECPNCENVSVQDGTQPGVECPVCDFSVMPCPECERPVEIPAEEDLERGGCPACGGMVLPPEDDDEDAICMECEWVGDPEAAEGDEVECDFCGEEISVMGTGETGLR